MHYEDAVNEIYNFCIQNNSTAILSDDNGALRFGEIKTDELAVTTSNITTAITFLDSETEYILVISSLSQTADIILSLMLRFFACCLCNYFVAMADGKVPPTPSVSGTKKSEDDLPEIVPEEVEIIRFAYKSYMEGQTTYTIAKAMTKGYIPTPAGQEKWHQSTIKSILTNEKYKGSALLQKKFATDFLTKKVKINEDEVPQYYIEESHEPIISPENFEQVQLEMTRRKKFGKQYSGNSLFATKIVCVDCGCFFGSKVWHSTSKYRRVI